MKVVVWEQEAVTEPGVKMVIDWNDCNKEEQWFV